MINKTVCFIELFSDETPRKDAVTFIWGSSVNS